MDYKNGRIYKITSDFTDKIYIGSTCQSLSRRMTTHKSSYKKTIKDGKYGNCRSYEIIKLNDAIITLVEDYPCERKEQLLSRERYWIDINKDLVVNKNMPGRSKKEGAEIYRKNNIEQIKEYDKERAKNRDKEKKKETDRKYREKNREKIRESQQKFRDKHKVIETTNNI